MVFKTVDGHLTSVFNKVEKINAGFDLTNDDVQNLINKFNTFNSNQSFGQEYTDFIAEMTNRNFNVSQMFDDISKRGASARASVKDFYAAILDGNTKGFSNVKSTMALFNQAQQSGADNARDFAKAVGQSNTLLGGYLSTLGTNGTATLKGYIGYLASATAKTIGLQLATAALNVGISLALNAIVWGITKVVNQMSELQDKIDDLKSDLDDTKSKIEDINSTLDKNKEKIKELNSEPLSITDKETLSTLQLENAELERQKKLLEEIEKQKAKALNDTTAEYLNKKSKLNVDDGYWKSVWNNFINPDSIVDDFNQIFDKNTTWGEKILNISKFVAPSLGNVAETFIPETRSILDETKSFKDELDKNIEEINKIIGDGSLDKIDYQAFANVMGDVNDLRGELSANIETLSTYRDSLSKTSKEYQTISGYINDYTNQLANLEKFDEYNIDGFTDNYFKIKDEFDKGLNGYLTSIHDNQNIDESILESLGTKFDETGRQFYALTGNYMEQFRQAEQLLKTFDNIELNRGLTYDESVIKSSVQLFYNTLSEEIEKYGEDYSNGKSSEAANIFNKYVDNYPIKDITKETYDEWRDGLLEQAQGDTEIKNDLIRMANGISLDIAKAIENKPFETTTQSLTELQEAIDNAFGNQSTIQSAFDKIQKGSSLSVDEVRKLVELCPKLASEFIKTSDGYTIGADKLIQANDDMLKSTKKSLQERADYLKKFLNTDYDTSKINGSYEAQKYSEWKQSITEAESELESLNLILTLFGLTTEDSTDKIEDLSKSTSNLVSKAKNLSSAFKEQNENGKLSEDTVLSLIENGYAAALMYDNKTGAIRLNTQAYLDLANAEIQQQITEIEIAKNDAMQDKLNAEHEMVANLGWSYLDTAEAALRYQSTIDRISNAETDISAYEAQINILENLKNALGQVTGGTYGETSNSKPQSVLNFEKELAEKEHEIAMGQREENEDYYSWLLSAAHTAYDGLADYQDDLWKYEEKVYEWRKKNEQDLFDQKIENAKTLADKILNDKVEVPEEAKKLAEFNKKMQKEYGLGNVDLTKRPKVSADAMRKAGYEAEDGETATVYSSFDFLWQGDEEHGKYVAVHYTPILPDGTVLDEKTLNDYLNTLVGSDDILKADTKGIILKVDSDVDVSDADVKSLETDKPTENIQNITKACDDWDIALHEVQAEWLDLSDAAEKAGTTATNKWDYAREIVNGYITDTQNRIKELENSGGKDNKDKIKSLKKDLESYKDDLDEIDEKEIKFNVEQTKKDLKKIDKEIEKIENDSITSDGTKLFGKEKWDTIESMYVSAAQKVQDQIDAIVKSGVKGNEDLLEELGETLDDYGDKIAELPKSAAKEEQEYLKNQKEKASKQIDEKINAVQKKIDALKKVNEKEQEALDIEKARQELEKASQSTRQIYGSDGSISFKVDDEKVKEAQENLDKILLEQQTSILEEQKDLLETEKDNSEKRFDILLDVLDEYLNPDQGESNSDVWKELAHLEGATYKNGVWTDKDGKAIDIDKLLETSGTAKKDDKQNGFAEGKKPTNSKDLLKGSSPKAKDTIIIGNLERQDIGDETSKISETEGKKPEEKAGSAIESFFSNLEKKLGLKGGSLSLDKVSDVLNGSNKMGYNPYANMTERVGTVGSEYANANNVNNNNVTNITIGDIVINNPVGNSDDLAKELRANLHNAADKIIYSNLR